MNNKEIINKMYHELKMSVVDISQTLGIPVTTIVEAIEPQKITY